MRQDVRIRSPRSATAPPPAAADLIRRYDGPDVLFYLDPPYVGCEGDYGDGFTPADFERLAAQLSRISGRFILSINDRPLAREVFGRFAIEEVPVTYTIGCGTNGEGRRAGELIVTGREGKKLG